MTVEKDLMCSFQVSTRGRGACGREGLGVLLTVALSLSRLPQILKPADKKTKYRYGGDGSRDVVPL
jgi:hypothetical protein